MVSIPQQETAITVSPITADNCEASRVGSAVNRFAIITPSVIVLITEKQFNTVNPMPMIPTTIDVMNFIRWEDVFLLCAKAKLLAHPRCGGKLELRFEISRRVSKSW